MKKLILSTMALVIGLFTVTTVFAFIRTEQSVKRAGEVMYYIHENEEAEEGWDDANNWTDEPNNDHCPTPTETVCRINLAENQKLEDFLQNINTFEELLKHNQVDLRDIP